MPQRPNILYILSDEHRGQAMSHMGDPNVRTPAMDRLAAEGVSFRRAYSNCPICTPARGTIFSGRQAHSGPVSGFFDVYKATAPSTATILTGAGYHTAYFGKWHCGTVRDQKPPLVRAHPDEYKGSYQRTPEYHRAGFEDWFGFENLNHHFASYYYKNRDVNPTKAVGYETDAYTDLVIDYLRNYHRPEPLFCVLSVTPPHFPLIVPDRWKRFNPASLSVRPNFTDTDYHRRCLAVYYAMIENLDWNIGRLMEAVGSLPQFRDTLTVYFSDHGDFMGSHGLQSRKEHPQEESIRIPAVFHWPGHIAPRGLIGGLFSLVDLMPTTLGLLGEPIPAHNQGSDFSAAIGGDDQNVAGASCPCVAEPSRPCPSPALTGKTPVARRGEDAHATSAPGPAEVLLEMVNNPRWALDILDWRGFVSDRWKYAFYETGAELLFDLHADPYEMNNLAAKDPDLCRSMRKRLLELLAASREPYFDVLIEHGVTPMGPVIDVSGEKQPYPGLNEV